MNNNVSSINLSQESDKFQKEVEEKYGIERR